VKRFSVALRPAFATRQQAKRPNSLRSRQDTQPPNSNRIPDGTYFRLVLELSAYPDMFPHHRKLAYLRESKQLVIEFELPTLDKAVPTQQKFRYIKKTDEIVEVQRSEKSRQELYSDAMAQAVLRCLYEVFCADTRSAVDTVVLNAHVFTLNRATGLAIRPCLISVRTSRDQFLNASSRNRVGNF
jgi:restriction system protein